MQVYDRWGNLIYKEQGRSINDPEHGWDGFFDGSTVSPGVYLYFADIEVNGGIVKVAGDVTVIE